MVLFIECVNVLACSSLEALYNSLPLMRKEFRMSVLRRQKGREAVIVKRTRIPLSEGACNEARDRATVQGMQNIPPLPRVHKVKVLAVRQQLAEGGYDFDERLDTAVDRLVATVTTWDNAAGCSC
jgi:hypothetical protein